MPVTNKKQIERIVSLCGCDPQSMRDAGIAYAIDHIADPIICDIEGIVLYTMNNSSAAHRIYEPSGLIKPR